MRAHTVIGTAQSPGGSVPSGNIFSSLPWVFTGTVTCVGGSGTGTLLDPRIGATSCDLADGARISSLPFSFYTAQPIDATVPFIPMLANYAATDLCNAPGSQNCPVQDLTVGVSSQTVVVKRSSATATTIHNAAHQPVLVVPVGTTVHDLVSVTSADGGPVPTGNVNIDWFLNGTCTGAPAVNSGSVGPLDAAGNFDATGFAFTVNSAGFRAFRAHYEGSGTYNTSDGPCEPLQVVDANIQLTPPTATNRVGTNHVLTCHINVNDGNGFTNAPAGTTCTGSIFSGPGSFVGPNSCNTIGTTGECQLTITSNSTGTTVIKASTDVVVAGVTLHRETGDGLPGDSANASKLWVNAAIVIAPNATNEIGQPHTFTVTVLQDTGSGLTPVGAGLPCNITLTPANGANPVPPGPFNLLTNASGQCSATFTSQTGGTVTGNASSTVTINGVVMNVSTDGVAPNSGPAVKTFVDANIQLTPANATNAVGTNHTLTCHININDGSGGFTNAPAGTTCTGSILSGPGSFVGSNSCNTIGATGSCPLVITSNVAGTTVVRATTTVGVGGVSLTRTTGDAHVGDSADANKKWVDAWIEINPPTDTNATGTNHVLTITVHSLNGTLGNGTATASIVSGPGSFVGSPSCNYTGGGASASCTVTITSAVTGTTKVHAASDIPVDGQTVHAETETAVNTTLCTAAGAAPCNDALKKWVDAWIEINPPSDNNPVGTNHVLTITVHAVNGTLGNGSATASIVSGPGSFVGSPTCNYTGGGASASCTVTITSATAGTTKVHATSNISVDGQSITRDTETAVNTALCTAAGANPCNDALKNWGDVTNVTQVHNAAHQDITGTTVTGGTVVHDQATVTRTAGTPASVPNPTGTVTFTLYDNGTCNGTVLATDANVPLGTESATFTTPANGSFSYRAHYNGDANYPAKDAACEPFTVATAGGQITPTQVSCEDFIGGSAPSLDGINYTVGANGKIALSINPGVFFYWTSITTTVPNQVVTTSQTNTSTNNSALFKAHQGWARLYQGDCSSWTQMTLINGGTAAQITVPTPGTYVIGIKYDAKSLAGTTPPVPADITFNFSTSLGASTSASVDLKKKP